MRTIDLILKQNDARREGREIDWLYKLTRSRAKVTADEARAMLRALNGLSTVEPKLSQEKPFSERSSFERTLTIDPRKLVIDIDEEW